MDFDVPADSVSEPVSHVDPKGFGAYYTGQPVADFIVWWAVRSATDTVLDPSFGGGVFLSSASATLTAPGGNPSRQIFGVELDSHVHESVSHALASQGVDKANLTNLDFFDFDARRFHFGTSN
ncbi:MAG: N-6 DNA methylase [Acidobacteria bacterium]|nr:N-6 DNA methylase [Acidobacteriota bacterium]